MKTTAMSEDNSFFETAVSRWISENSTQGILVTDTDLKIRYCNRWIESQTGKKESELVGIELFSVFPEIETRGLGHYYRHALTGEGRVLSHRLHKYLIAVPTKNGAPGVDRMQQSCRIGALTEGEEIVGTITIIDDVTERVARERELKIQLDE